MLINDQIISTAKTVVPLPQKYTSVLPAAFLIKTKQFKVPTVENPVRPKNSRAATEATKAEWKRLETTMESLSLSSH